MYYYLKRTIDIMLVIVSLPITIPLFIILAILIRLKLGSPILFFQYRPGYKEKIFKLVKFRTMNNMVGVDGKLLPDKLRINKFGIFMRSTSLDELPELFNIFKGDMSIVGPRPLLIEYLERYTNNQRRRHDVLPGLTGIAQINGRNAISWEQKFSYDIWYVENKSTLLDLTIIIKTAAYAFRRKDISSPGEVTATEFKAAKP